MEQDILQHIASKNGFESQLAREIAETAQIKTIAEGFSLMEIGQSVTHMPLLLNGALKIMQEDDDGEDLILYFIESGDTCAMTMNCCMGGAKSKVKAVAELDTELLLIPVKYIDDWMAKYPSWRQFVLNSYNQRFSELLNALDSIAFFNMDERILKYLEEKANIHKNNSITVTHQEIATDLHSSRVVISRILKKLEKEGILRIHRNQIELL